MDKLARDMSVKASKPSRKHTSNGAPRDEAYGDRNTILRRMGFKSYAEYLRSDTYKQIRRRAFKEYGEFCEVCGEPAAGLHHSDYSKETLEGDISGLVPLCVECHEHVEISRNGKKRTLADANRLLESMLRRKHEKGANQ
jgi:hypothetical protein